jgi:cold-inducible RNA-binding protein
MESKLYVGNLSYNISEEQLRELFGQAGEIKEVSLIMDRDTRRPKGFGFVEMTTQADAEKAIQMFNEYELDGRKLTVNMARPREERGGGGGGYRGGYGGGGGRGGYGGGGGRGGGRGGYSGNRKRF